MHWLDAIWLGLVQALTEFLPVSSSGHLRLAHLLLEAHSDQDLLFDVLLHGGTLLAVVAVYRRDLSALLGDALSHLSTLPRAPRQTLEQSEGLRTLCLLALATLPTGILGLTLKPILEGDALGARAVGIALLCNAALLWSSRAAWKQPRDGSHGWLSVDGIGVGQALMIGLAQGCAVLPGISRSGATIVAALWLGAQPLRAARFSFLLSIPAILGALVLQFKDLQAGSLAREMGENAPAYLGGALVACLGGTAALLLLLGLLRQARFHHFAWYSAALGCLAIALAP